MNDHDTEFEKFKEGFRKKLATTIHEREGEIGNPADWQVSSIVLTTSHPYITLKNNNLLCDNISVGVPKLRALSAEARLELRRYINQACANEGIRPYEPRGMSLSSEIIEGVKRGDSEAWEEFVGKHERQWSANAASLLGNGPSDTLLEGEDIVSQALAKMFRHRDSKHHPTNLSNKAIHSEARQIARSPHKMRKQAGGGEFDQILQPEHDGLPEALAEQLPEILIVARKLMTPRQREVLDAIIVDVEQGENLRVSAIAERLGISHQMIHQHHLPRITDAIRQAADRPEFAEAAAVIDGLVRINEKSQQIRR